MISFISDSPVIEFFVLFLIWAITHSILASLTLKDFLSSRLGRLYYFYRVFFVLVSIISLVAIFLIVPLPSDKLYSFNGPVFYLLKTMQTAALIAFLFTATTSIEDDFLGFREAKRFFSARLNVVDKRPLRTDGIMRYSRHPLYFFAAVLLWSDPKMTIGWATMSLAFCLYFLIGTIFEERKLISIFGSEYLDYQKRVRRFIPIKRLVSGTRSERSL